MRRGDIELRFCRSPRLDEEKIVCGDERLAAEGDLPKEEEGQNEIGEGGEEIGVVLMKEARHEIR